jgi:hypothetical protein
MRPSVGQEECTRKGEEKELILKDAGEKDFKMASRFPNRRLLIALRCWRAICGLSLTCHRHVYAQLQHVELCDGAHL